MKNFIQSIKSIVVPAPGNVLSGDFVTIGALFGVCEYDALNGADVVIVRQGVFELPKATGTAWTKGDQLYWDAVAKKFTKVAAGNKSIGIAGADAASGDATGYVSIENVDGLTVVYGQQTTVAAADTVATGLSKVLAAVGSLESDPSDDPFEVTVQIGDQNGAPIAGSIIIKTWKNTGGTDPTPAAATTFSKKVNWIAVGY